MPPDETNSYQEDTFVAPCHYTFGIKLNVDKQYSHSLLGFSLPETSAEG